MALLKVVGMRKLRVGLSLIGISIYALLLLNNLPGPWANEMRYADSTFSYVVMGLFFYLAVYFLGLQSLEYFRLPRIHFKTLLALLIASPFVIAAVTHNENTHLKPWVTVRGICFLLAIGFGEEIFSRGFTFGVLRQFGNVGAIFFSSALFGLMHLNLYIGNNWDAWLAYSHVMNTFSFGVFICALMIVTRSIWVAVIFHALIDWGIVFDKASIDSGDVGKWQPGMWEGLSTPLVDVFIYCGLALVLLWIDRSTVPVWMRRLALRWKLVKPEFEIAA